MRTPYQPKTSSIDPDGVIQERINDFYARHQIETDLLQTEKGVQLQFYRAGQPINQSDLWQH